MDVEVEAFEITDHDLQNEFNPNRRRHRLTKNQQIYGIFAPAEDDVDERPSFGGRRDYTAPINFVGGGVQQAGKKEEKPKEDDYESYSSNDDEVPSTSRASQMTGKKRPAGAYRGQGATQDFGDWEKHTKGIGLKILLQQGFQPGKGLGKRLDGISEPVEAKQRKGRGAVGAYGSERTEKQIRQNEIVVDSEEEEEKEFRKQLGQWKKSEEGKKKVKYVYKTVDDVISEGGQRKVKGDTSQLSKVKVIDMTGPEQRILSGYHAIHNQHSKPAEVDDDKGTRVYQHFALPELIHNLNLLVDMTEQEIVRNDREMKFEQDQIVNMNHEKEKLHNVLEEEEKQLDALEVLIKVIEGLETRGKETSDRCLSLPETAKILRDLQKSYYDEYRLYEMSEAAVGIVIPMLKKYFDEWKPLEDLRYGLDVMKEWKDIFDDGTDYKSNKIEPYDKLVWETWMPCLRRFVMSWNCRNCDPLIELLENWMPLLPTWIMENVLDQVVMPRLQQEVDSWNPLTDHVPIDAWIHPWLPIMGERLEVLYPTIRHKLANGLLNWDPSDCSAKRVLQPWVAVFSQGSMDAFLIKNVLPKLANCLQDFQVNPHQQLLEPWKWVMDWEDVMPLDSMVSILERHFFQKWFQVLCAWLGHNPNYDEITKWFLGWKSMFSSKISSHPYIKEQFNRALDVMNHAVSGPPGPMGYPMGARDHFAYLASLDRRREAEPQNVQQPMHTNQDYEILGQAMQNPGATMSLSFKDLVERRAIENGLIFMPVPNRYHEAKQVYRLGRQLIYLDRQVLFVYRDNMWVPISLQSLMDFAK